MTTITSFLVVALPQWATSVWALFYSEPLVPWLSKHGIPHLTFPAWWITVPVGLAMLALMVYAGCLRAPAAPRQNEADGIIRHIFQELKNDAKARAPIEDARREKRKSAIQTCLDRYANVHDRSHLPAFSLIKAGAYTLEDNLALVTLCEKLHTYGHDNPLDYWRGYVPDDDALEFLQALTYSPKRLTDDARGAGVIHVAMSNWRRDHNYPEPSHDRQLDAIANTVFAPSSVPPIEVPTFRVTALDPTIDGDEFVARLLFQNDGESDRIVLSIRAIYWAPDRIWKNSYMFLGDDAGSMRLGNIDNSFVLCSKLKQTVVHRIKVLPDFLKTPQADFGLQIITGLDVSGTPQDVNFPLIRVISAPESAGGVNYALHSAVNVSLDNATSSFINS